MSSKTSLTRYLVEQQRAAGLRHGEQALGPIGPHAGEQYAHSVAPNRHRGGVEQRVDTGAVARDRLAGAQSHFEVGGAGHGHVLVAAGRKGNQTPA